MNNFLFQSIISMEKENYLKNFIYKKGKISYFRSKINSYLMPLISLFRLPKYYLPKNNISEAVTKAQKYLIINIGNFNAENQYDNEIKKVLLRIDLRYNYEQQILLSSFVKQILKGKNKSALNFSQYKWTSPLYPIIHLPNDKSEEGRMHNDLINIGLKGSSVAWLPFTDYKYPGIVKLNYSSSLLAHFLPTKIESYILNNAREFTIKRKHNKGNWMAWNDTFYHKGVLNASDKVSSALIIRFSNKFSKETFLPVKSLKSVSDGLFLSNKREDHDILVINAKLIAKEIIDTSRNIRIKESFNSKIIDIITQKGNLKDKFNSNQILCIFHIVDYALTLFIQRFDNNSIDWLGNDNKYLMREILVNLNIAKNFLNEELYKLISKLKSSSNMNL